MASTNDPFRDPFRLNIISRLLPGRAQPPHRAAQPPHRAAQPPPGADLTPLINALSDATAYAKLNKGALESMYRSIVESFNIPNIRSMRLFNNIFTIYTRPLLSATNKYNSAITKDSSIINTYLTEVNEINSNLDRTIAKLTNDYDFINSLKPLFNKLETISTLFEKLINANTEAEGQEDEELLKKRNEFNVFYYTAIKDFIDIYLDLDANVSQYTKLFDKITTQLAVREAELPAELQAELPAELHKYTLEYLGGFTRRRSKFPSYKYYLKAFKSYSKRKLKTYRKRRNYKKTKRGKH